MKRLEIVVQTESTKKVIDAINKIVVGGITVTQALGQGKGERPWVGGEKGKRIEFNSIDTIVTVVEDSVVSDLVSTIIDQVHTGKKGDGKVFVSNVEETFDISTKGKGDSAL